MSTKKLNKLPPQEAPERVSLGLKNGYRSGLEHQVAEQLEQHSVPVDYENMRIKYVQPSKVRTYTPDFVLPNGIIIETKGRFTSADRQKHLLIQDQHPDLDIRFVFSNPNSKINKRSSTTYAMWCEKNGFLYDKQYIPESWLSESNREIVGLGDHTNHDIFRRNE